MIWYGHKNHCGGSLASCVTCSFSFPASFACSFSAFFLFMRSRLNFCLFLKTSSLCCAFFERFRCSNLRECLRSLDVVCSLLLNWQGIFPITILWGTAFQRCVTWGEKTLDQWVYFFLKLVENFKMAYLVGACEVFSSAVLSLDSVMGKE